MIPKAREVRLKPKTRKVLEARCRAPTTAQRDVKRARIVLLAAEGRSTRSIAEEVGVQPRIVSNWRRRFAEHGLADCRTGHGPARSRSTARPRTSAFWRFWISRRLRATPDERVRCWPRHWATLMFSMSGFLREHISTLPPASRGARATTLRSWRKPPMWSGFMSIRPSRRLFSVSTKSLRSRRWSVRKAI